MWVGVSAPLRASKAKVRVFWCVRPSPCIQSQSQSILVRPLFSAHPKPSSKYVGMSPLCVQSQSQNMLVGVSAPPLRVQIQSQSQNILVGVWGPPMCTQSRTQIMILAGASPPLPIRSQSRSILVGLWGALLHIQSQSPSILVGVWGAPLCASKW